MKKVRLSPAPTQLHLTLALLHASGYLDTSFDGKEVHQLIIRPLTKKEALDEYKKSGGKTSIWDKLEKNMSYSTPKEETFDVMIMKFNKSISRDDAIAEMDKFGVCSLDPEKLIQYCIANPSHQEQNPLCSLKTSILNLNGYLYSFLLSVGGAGRRMSAVPYVDVYKDMCRFPVVLK